MVSGLVVSCEPSEPLVKSVTRGGTRGLHEPISVPDPRQTELLLDFVRLQRYRREIEKDLYRIGCVKKLGKKIMKKIMKKIAQNKK